MAALVLMHSRMMSLKVASVVAVVIIRFFNIFNLLKGGERRDALAGLWVSHETQDVCISLFEEGMHIGEIEVSEFTDIHPFPEIFANQKLCYQLRFAGIRQVLSNPYLPVRLVDLVKESREHPFSASNPKHPVEGERNYSRDERGHRLPETMRA
jgi:hypothetical protein